MQQFKFFNSSNMNRFIELYENSKFIYTNYESIKIIDNLTIEINSCYVWYHLATEFCNDINKFGTYNKGVK